MKQGQKIRRTLWMLFAMLVLLSLMPGMVLVAEETNYELWVGNTRVTSANKDNILNDNATPHSAVYDPNSNTLTLNSCTVSRADGSCGTIQYNNNTALNIELHGTNTIMRQLDNSDGSDYDISGISAERAQISISGDGSLTCECKDKNGMRIKNSIGIYAKSLRIESGTVTAIGGAGKKSFGVNGIVDVSGGKLTAIGGKGKDGSFGIHSGNQEIIIYGGTVEAIGGTANQNSIGICLTHNRMTIGNGITSLTAVGNNCGFVGEVMNAVAGTGWADSTGSAGQSVIEVSSSYRTLPVYKKIQFPAPPSYTVTITNDGHGTASASPTSGATGTKVTLTSTPDAGYRFQGWQVLSGGVTITGNEFTIGTANVEVKAVFEQIAIIQPSTGENPSTGTQPVAEAMPVDIQEPITIAKAPSSVKAKAKKNQVTVTWKKIKKTKKTKALLAQIKSVQVQYSTDQTFTQNTVTKTVGKNKTKAVLKLQKKTTYYVRVRYKGADGVSRWSGAKRVKTK